MPDTPTQTHTHTHTHTYINMYMSLEGKCQKRKSSVACGVLHVARKLHTTSATQDALHTSIPATRLITHFQIRMDSSTFIQTNISLFLIFRDENAKDDSIVCWCANMLVRK